MQQEINNTDFGTWKQGITIPKPETVDINLELESGQKLKGFLRKVLVKA